MSRLMQNIPAETRFWAQVQKGAECWEWVGCRLWNGYGQIKVGGKKTKAHRYSWQLHYGDISGLVLHKCDNPACVRPDHLYLGDQKDNARDRDTRGRNGFSKRTHCPAGHPYTEENTYRHGSRRSCRICRNMPLPTTPQEVKE